MGRVPRLGGPPSRQPLRPPAGTLKAKDFKKRCLQATLTQDSTYGNEDCLYLNIWVPQGRKEGPFPSAIPSSFPGNQRPGSGPWVVSGGSRAELPDISTDRTGLGGWGGAWGCRRGASGITEPAPLPLSLP